MPAPPYRCALCLESRLRCESCRKRRAKARSRTLQAKKNAGRCIECTRKAVAGQTRCSRHRRLNIERTVARARKLTSSAA